MEYFEWMEGLKKAQKRVSDRPLVAYYATVRYRNGDWFATRFDDENIEMERVEHGLFETAKHMALTWMDMFNVTRVYVYNKDGELVDTVMQGNKNG